MTLAAAPQLPANSCVLPESMPIAVIPKPDPMASRNELRKHGVCPVVARLKVALTPSEDELPLAAACCCCCCCCCSSGEMPGAILEGCGWYASDLA